MNDQTTPDPTTDNAEHGGARPMRPTGKCSVAALDGARIETDEPHHWISSKGANTIFVRTCSMCGEIDWDDLREETAKHVAAEVDRLTARVGELEGQLATARGLAETWLRNAENVRGSADRLPGLSKVEKAELKQGAIELEHCAHQLRNTLGLDGGGSDA